MTRTTQKSATPASGKPKPALTRSSPQPLPSKLDLLVNHLRHRDGATLAELAAATGWQVHSVRGALAGSLKKKGHVITSKKVDGVRRYHAGAPK